MDQLFSCLAHQFKSDILTIETLKDKILTAPITPKPICRNLDFIYDWKSFINNKLTHPPLKYTSKYHSFLFTTQTLDGVRHVKFFGKKYPQDVQMVPRAGIRIIQEDIEFVPVGIAEYRVEIIKFDEIWRGIQVYLSKQPASVRIEVMTSWDRLRERIEALPRRGDNFPKMKLSDFPIQQAEVYQAPEYLLQDPEDGDGCELTGDKYPETVDEGDIESEIAVGMDVCIFTDEKRGRPWVGRVIQILEGGRFIIHWYIRKSGRGNTFTASFEANGSRSVTELETGTVMFWSMSENRTKNSFSLSLFWLENIRREYSRLEDEGL